MRKCLILAALLAVGCENVTMEVISMDEKAVSEAPVVVEGPKLWVALVNVTEHIVVVSEKFDDEAGASWRLMSLKQQVEMEAEGFGSYPKDDEWLVYHGSTEFAW